MKYEKIRDISILLAEDETDLREATLEYLQMFFSRVYSAKCGKEAYKLYKEKKPNIILTDINMPNMDGLTLISKIREEDKEVKIIVMSAHSEQDKLLKAIKLHLETYLVKPIKTDALKQLLFDTVDLIRVTYNRVYFRNTSFWDKNSNSFFNEDKEILLKNKETMLLKLLCSQPNQNFSPQDIFFYLHPLASKDEFSSDAVTSLIKRLRNTLPKNTIQTVYGAGYKVTPI